MPTAPRQPCTAPGCAELRPCPAHPVKQWRRRPGAQPRTELSGSAEQARAKRIIRRDGGICYVCGKPGADQADHVVARSNGGPDIDENLAAIHATPCHQAKTAEEAADARRRHPRD